MAQVFNNSNGQTFNVISTLEFNKVDQEYYKNSWQKHRAMLLERNEEYIVASYVGEDSWGFGYYADGIKDATKKFNSIMQDYNK
jgi:hypothetical protein